MPASARGCRSAGRFSFSRIYASPHSSSSLDRLVHAAINPCAINDSNASIDCMASITIRQLPESTTRRLRVRAAQNGRSMEQEARELLEKALSQRDADKENLGEQIHRRFARLGGVDLKIPPRGPIRDPGIR
ncbi:MAG: FitA-like ribbon-helix-helix domain-containing protein [Candidatus Sulfotelmatobacter sp.]